MKALLLASIAVFVKDLRSEVRTRYALNTLVLFAASTAVAVSLGIGGFLGMQRDEEVLLIQSTFLWIALLFAALNGLSRSFVHEEETRTTHALRLAAPPLAVYLGKFFFNLTLLVLLDSVTSVLFVLLVQVKIGNVGLFVAMLAMGSVCLATGTTILAAMIARASVKHALFAVLAFPILVPPLIVAIQGTAPALAGASWQSGFSSLQSLLAYAIATFVASLFLFGIVWDT